jgi:hypothetical protein
MNNTMPHDVSQLKRFAQRQLELNREWESKIEGKIINLEKILLLMKIKTFFAIIFSFILAAVIVILLKYLHI